MQFNHFTKAALCLSLLLPSSAFSADKLAGNYLTMSGVQTQVSSFAGTAKVNSLTVTLPTGVCQKVYIGTSSSMGTGAYFTGIIRVLYPAGCSAYTIQDSWTIQDSLNNADGIDPADYWVLGPAGVQIEWATVTRGVAALKILRPIKSGGYALSVGTAIGVIGDHLVEIDIIPGMIGKQYIGTWSSGYTGTIFTLNPQYFIGAALTTPTPQSWRYQATTQNGIGTDLTALPSEAGEYALVSVWQYQ